MESKFPVAFLRRMGPSSDHKCIPLDSEEVSVGRAKDNNYTIADLLVSRKHAIFRFKNDEWTVRSVGMNGVAINHVQLPKDQEILLQNMDTVEFGAGSKFVYAFRVQVTGAAEEPLAKKFKRPLADRNYPTMKDSPEAFKQWIRSKKSLEKTLVEESDSLDAKLELQTSLKEKLVLEQEKLNEHLETAKKELERKFTQEKKELEDKVTRGELEKTELQREKEVLEERMSKRLQEFQVECERKNKEFEESVAQANVEKQALIEQKEFIVQQLTREKKILEERLEEESRLREATVNELAQIKESHQFLERELGEARRKIEEEMKQYEKKGSEDELRLQKMQQELAQREAQLIAKEREVADIQSRAAIGLEMYESLQILQQEQAGGAGNGIVVVVDQGQASGQPSAAELELEKVREELRAQKELNKQQQQASNKACIDIVGQMENIMENELQCGICSELIVFATVLNCMHTFCQFCVNQWKKNKVECPICRAPITTEGKNILVDNMIDAMVCSLSEELKNRRKELVKQRQELYIQPIEQKSDGMNATRGLNMAPVVDRSINGRGRPRRTIATPGRSGVPAPPAAPPATRMSVPQGNTSTVQGAVRTRASVNRPPTATRPATFRPIAPAPHIPNPNNVGSAVIPVTEEVVVLSSGSDSSSEESAVSRNISIIELTGEVTNRPQNRRRRKRRSCNSCGRVLSITGSCGFCNS